MTRSLKALGLLAIGVLAFSVPASADNDGVSFDGNILFGNNGGGAQYDQTPYGALSQTTETFVNSNFSNNRIIDPLLDPNFNVGVAGPWRPTTSSPALYANGAPVVKASDIDPFFKDVPYQGALNASAAGDWTRGWIYTNLQGGLGRTDIDTGKPIVNVTSDITTNTTWSSANNYTLSGRIAVSNGATLTIEPGTVIVGLVAGSYLVVERDGMIDAVGSAANPIIFTSGADFTSGAQTPGDWAGIVIMGNATANCAAGGVIAGCNSTTTGNDCTSEGGAGFFGGSDDTDNRGRMIFVRSEYAGQEISPNNELNAFTFNAVGSGTTLEYLQAHRGTDDCFEWFGGASRSRYFVGTGGDDDGLDWQMGYHGYHQFAVIVATALDNANADKGMECDNNEFDFSCPGESNGIMANLTLIGEPTLTTNGIHFRRGTNGGVFNSIIVGWLDAGFRMQHDETFDNGVGPQPGLYSPSSGGVSFDGNILFGNNGGGAQYDQTPYGALVQNTEQFVTANFSANRVVDPLLNASYNNGVAGPWRPQAASPALFENNATPVRMSDIDDWFDDNDYIGALRTEAGFDWTRNWIYTNLQGGLGRTDIDTGKPIVNVTSDITTNTTWSSANNYTLSGRIAVSSGATLTIEPGTVIVGLVAGSYLVIERDGMIDAQGTESSPIIFTSGADFTSGAQTPGDWAGIVIMGNAVANCAAGGAIAGCNSTTTGNDCTSEGGAGFFGGSDDTDNRGIMRYVRSEYAGQEISPNNELNAFTFNAVGSGTTLEYLQAHRGTDDCFEWFGGASRTRYFVGTGGDDDGLDWQMGYRGFHQYAVIVATALDNANADKGMECDNNEFDFSCPGESNGIMANLTLIGEPTLTTNGIHFRRGTNGGVFNSIIVDWLDAGFRMQHDETFDNGVGPRPTLYTSPPPTGIGGPSVSQPAFRVSLDRNPVVGNSNFMFTLNTGADVQIRIFNVQGRLVDTVHSGYMGQGPHMVGWNPRSKASGVYLYQVQAGRQVATGKLTVVN